MTPHGAFISAPEDPEDNIRARSPIGPSAGHTAKSEETDKTEASGSAALASSRGRVRHTRFAVVALLPLVVMTSSMWGTVGALHESLEWLGYAMIIACVLGRAWSTTYVGGRKKHELVRQGPYSIVRNPLYCFSFMGVVGIGLLTGTFTWTLVAGLAFAIYYRAVVRREEAYLLSSFPTAYRLYLLTVPRWIPDFRLWRDTEGEGAKPNLIYRSLRDGAWFFIAFPLMEGIDALHAAALIPSLVPLP